MWGNRVVVVLEKTGWLSLCEVEVFVEGIVILMVDTVTMIRLCASAWIILSV